MSWLIYPAAVGLLGTALFVWLWRRERKARQRAEAAAATHQVRWKAASDRANAVMASHNQLAKDLAAVQKQYDTDIANIQKVRDAIEVAVEEDDDQAVADLWNGLFKRGRK